MEDFEAIYYCRKASHLYFCWQSVYGLSHLAPDVARLGPGIYFSQWTLEQTIGNLGQEIKQLSNPYANLGNCGLQRSQFSALHAIIPGLASDTVHWAYPEEQLTLGTDMFFSGPVMKRVSPSMRDVQLQYAVSYCLSLDKIDSQQIGSLNILAGLDFVFQTRKSLVVRGRRPCVHLLQIAFVILIRWRWVIFHCVQSKYISPSLVYLQGICSHWWSGILFWSNHSEEKWV